MSEFLERVRDIINVRRVEWDARKQGFLDSADRLRQRADALEAALRRGDPEPLSCEWPRTPEEIEDAALREAFREFVEQHEREQRENEKWRENDE